MHWLNITLEPPLTSETCWQNMLGSYRGGVLAWAVVARVANASAQRVSILRNVLLRFGRVVGLVLFVSDLELTR